MAPPPTKKSKAATAVAPKKPANKAAPAGAKKKSVATKNTSAQKKQSASSSAGGSGLVAASTSAGGSEHVDDQGNVPVDMDSLIASNNTLKQQIEDLQRKMNSYLDHNAPVQTPARYVVPPPVQMTMRSGKKTTIACTAEKGKRKASATQSKPPAHEDKDHEEIGEVDDSQEYESEGIDDTQVQHVDKAKKTKPPSIQQQLDSLKQMVQALSAPKDDVVEQEEQSDDDMQIDETSVADAIQDAFGRDGITGKSGDSECAISYMIAGSTLDSKIKSKIWSQEYVELGLLWPRNEMNNNNSTSSSANASSGSARPRQPSNFIEWFRLFTTYMSVYLMKFKDEGSALASYMQHIYGLSARVPQTYVWRTYDEKFRQLRAFCTDLPWHVRNAHVLSDAEEAISIAGRNSFRRQSKFGPAKGGKTGVCYDFNKFDKMCTRKPCKYPHRCSKCGAGHPAFACSKPSNTPSSNSGAGPSHSRPGGKKGL